jgi:ADP-ribose pyrophosphatase
MALGRWRRLWQKELFRNPWWTYRVDGFALPSGRLGEYHCAHTHGSAMVAPLLADGRLLLVNQYRYLLDRESLELPCGGVKAGSTHLETARAELAEEAGFTAGALMSVGSFNPCNGLTDEICEVFLATGLGPTGDVEADETEEFERLVLTPAEIEARIATGEIWDGMTIAAWHLLVPHLAPRSEV